MPINPHQASLLTRRYSGDGGIAVVVGLLHIEPCHRIGAVDLHLPIREASRCVLHADMIA